MERGERGESKVVEERGKRLMGEGDGKRDSETRESENHTQRTNYEKMTTRICI